MSDWLHQFRWSQQPAGGESLLWCVARLQQAMGWLGLLLHVKPAWVSDWLRLRKLSAGGDVVHPCSGAWQDPSNEQGILGGLFQGLTPHNEALTAASILVNWVTTATHASFEAEMHVGLEAGFVPSCSYLDAQGAFCSWTGHSAASAFAASCLTASTGTKSTPGPTFHGRFRNMLAEHSFWVLSQVR